MTMPNFLIIGAMKSGTTALYYHLAQHPQVYMSPLKEPNFFAFEGEDLYSRWPDDQKGMNEISVTNLKSYHALFKEVTGERAVGEASHWYLFSPKAAGRIHHYLPDVKLIAVLRNPVERAYSHFLHSVRTETEHVSDFVQALQDEAAGDRRESDAEHYIDRGFYYAQLSRYFDVFDHSQIRIYLYDDLRADPAGVLRSMFEFLEVDRTFLPDVSTKRNVSGLPRNKLLDALLRNLLRKPRLVKILLKRYLPPESWRRLSKIIVSIRNRNLAKPPPLDQEVRRQLIEVYREDVLKLQRLVGRDLSGWLQ